MRVGVLAIQGSFSLHINVLNRLGVDTAEVKCADQIENLDGLIIPGGESTTFALLLDQYGIINIIQERVKQGLPVWGTCAGAIMLGHGRERPQPRFELIDVEVMRNAYGRQIDSFIKAVKIKGFNKDFPGVFIRAPRFYNTASHVEILAKVNDEPVMVRQNHVLITSFHPELTPDNRVHQYFIQHVCSGFDIKHITAMSRVYSLR